MVTQMGFARGGLHSDTGHNQSVVRAVHTALGRGLFVLLDSHGLLLGIYVAKAATCWVSETRNFCNPREAFNYSLPARLPGFLVLQLGQHSKRIALFR